MTYSLLPSFVQMYINGNLLSLKQASVMFGWLMLICSLSHLGIYASAEPVALVELSDGYVGYRPSSGLGVILAAPHGGLLEPEGIPERDAGCWKSDVERCVWNHSCGEKNITKCNAVTVDDVYTQDLTEELHDSLCALFCGACPAAVFNRLSRRFFDANRDLEEATFMVPAVVEAYDRFHRLIDGEAKKMGGTGLFIDIHGHGHPTQRAELGYLVSGVVLNSGSPIDPKKTSIRSLAHRSRVDFDELLRGAESFGGFLESYGFDAVPSPKNRGPGDLPYFNGGPNTRRHGSIHNGSFDAIQIESARSPREPGLRRSYVKALAGTIRSYYCKYYVQNQTQRTVLDERLSTACAADSAVQCSGHHHGLHSPTGGYLYVATLSLALLLLIH